MKITPEILYDRWRKAVSDRDWVVAFVLGKAIDSLTPDGDLFRKMRERRESAYSAISGTPATPALPPEFIALKYANKRLCDDFLMPTAEGSDE